MNNELREIKLWQQYKDSDEIVKFFAYVRKRFQKKYMDIFYKKNEDGKLELGEYGKEFGINNGLSDWMEYYIENIYALRRPSYLVNKMYYDSQFTYDAENPYDSPKDIVRVPIDIYLRIFRWVCNYKLRAWSAPTLHALICQWGNLPVDEVKIQTHIYGDIEVVCSPNIRTQGLTILWRTHNSLFQLPLGVKIIITLRNPKKETVN